MIVEALKYPFKDDKLIKKTVIASLLVIGSIFIIPIFTLLGYLLRTMREDSLPGFNNLGQMTLEGLKASGVILVYMFIPFALVLTENGILAGIGAFLYLIAAYLIYSAFYEISNNGWKAAFTKKVVKNTLSIRYFGGLIAAGIVSWLILIVYAFTLFLIVPILLLPAVYLYQYMFIFRVMTRAIEN